MLGFRLGPWSWSSPGDALRWTALLLAPVVAALLWRGLSERAARWVARFSPLAAAALSAGYVVHYLRGGPRIIDATAYYLEARGLSQGLLALPIGEPENALLGRFMLRTDWHGPAASVIFPPGWPAALAVGFWLGAPLAIGPLLAAAVCATTIWLTRLAASELGADLIQPTVAGITAATSSRLAAAAGLASVACAALRYHTADTMSHGWAALCLSLALASGWSALRSRSRAMAALAGLAASWLFATRPVTAIALALTIFLATLLRWHPAACPAPAPAPAHAHAHPLALLLAFALAAVPPLLLFFCYQHAATGSAFASAQQRYYALSDGPPDCFRYGFGAGIGCRGEHGEFVAHNLAGGYGLVAALGTTGRRMLHHVADVLNFAPLAALPLAALLARGRLIRILALAVAAQIAAYAPFYFDGSYPGGGARMFADALPLEHVLTVVGLVALAHRFRRRLGPDPFARATAITFALALAGFAVGAGADHAELRAREGGRPMFEPAELRAAGVDPTADLVFFDTDHGFDLAFAPGRKIARLRGDALDRLSWERAGRPRAFRYAFRSRELEPAEVKLEPIAFDRAPTDSLPLRIGASSLWPPATQQNGWAWLDWSVPDCGPPRKALRIRGDRASWITLRLPAAAAARELAPILVSGPQPFEINLLIDGYAAHTWHISDVPQGRCTVLAPVLVPAAERSIELELRGAGWAVYALALSEKR